MRKNIILIISCTNCIFCSTQTKINKNKEIDIIVSTPINLAKQTPIKYTLLNNSKNTYIIDPYGFTGYSYWLFENKKLNPIYFSKGYYAREGEDCESDLIIIKPKQKIDTILNLNYIDRGRYDLSKQGNYFWYVKSKHDRKNGMPLSCKKYIDDLEGIGYRFLEDSIVAKILFVREE
ncbi:hypothetical protein [Flavobacterium sp. B17]|uniref:hypothetical protein n=1 Tax=Flavobacterium sp. B17 TaxID=95618 RepID=UPI000346EC4F|nr:hypothetical protein [Flavobacterium sp. B17]